MTTFKIEDNWILWWLILVPTAVIVGKNMYEPAITLGEIIGLGIAVPAIIVGVWKTVKYIWYRVYPFRLEYQAQHLWTGRKRPTFKELSLPLGDSTFIVRVQPRRPTTFKRIHLRLLDKPNINARYPDTEVVDIRHVSISGEGLLSPLEGIQHDKTNGIQGNLQEHWDCASEESLYLEIDINANSY